MKGLKADFKALKAHMSEMNKRPFFVKVETDAHTLAFQSGRDRSEAVSLRKKVNRLQKKLKAKSGNIAEQQVATAAIAMKTGDHVFSAQQQCLKSDSDRFSYRWGEDR